MMQESLYKEVEDLFRIYDRFKKHNRDFLNDYKRYLDDLTEYKKHKVGEKLTQQEQFCGDYSS